VRLGQPVCLREGGQAAEHALCQLELRKRPAALRQAFAGGEGAGSTWDELTKLCVERGGVVDRVCRGNVFHLKQAALVTAAWPLMATALQLQYMRYNNCTLWWCLQGAQHTTTQGGVLPLHAGHTVGPSALVARLLLLLHWHIHALLATRGVVFMCPHSMSGKCGHVRFIMSALDCLHTCCMPSCNVPSSLVWSCIGCQTPTLHVQRKLLAPLELT
jgi:hypothetical protein